MESILAMGIGIVLTGGTYNSPLKLDGKVLPGLESNFFGDQKQGCPKTAQEGPEQAWNKEIH